MSEIATAAASEHARVQAAHALPAPSFEARDLTLRQALVAACGVAVMVVGLAVLAALLYPRTGTIGLRDADLPEAARPALQSSPRADMDSLRHEQRAWLDGAGWVDRARGVAHVPIERAMRDVVARGWGP